MPILRYTLRVEGEEGVFTEEDTFKPKVGIDETKYSLIIQEEILTPLNANRAKLNEPLLQFVKVVVLSACVHLHQWKRTGVNRFTERTYYHCERCGVTGSKYTKLFDGEVGGLRRDEAYKNAKYELCRDPLKPMPKALDFGE